MHSPTKSDSQPTTSQTAAEEDKQLEMQKKTNASPDGKPLGAGKRMEMFSKSKNTWEKFTVVDFEGSKGLYKCEFGGGRCQWLNLRQKELRDL